MNSQRDKEITRNILYFIFYSSISIITDYNLNYMIELIMQDKYHISFWVSYVLTLIFGYISLAFNIAMFSIKIFNYILG